MIRLLYTLRRLGLSDWQGIEFDHNYTGFTAQDVRSAIEELHDALNSSK